jgi:hypothetical protein
VHQTTLPPSARPLTPQGRGQLLDQAQATPTLGLGVVRDQAQQPRAGVVDGDVEDVPAQLQPQPQRGPGVHDRVGDQLVGQQLGPVDDMLAGQGEPPVLEHVADVQPGRGRSGRRRGQGKLVPQVGRPGGDLVQRLLEGVVQRQELGHGRAAQHLGDGRPGAAEQEAGRRPVAGGMVGHGREHRRANGVDGVHAAQVADDPVGPLGQVLEQHPLDPWGREQVDLAGDADHGAPVARGMVELHSDLPAFSLRPRPSPTVLPPAKAVPGSRPGRSGP